MLQDVTTLDGRQLKDAAVIVASPPCQEYAYRSMPWKLGRVVAPEEPPQWWFKPENKMSKAELAEWRRYKEQNPLPPTDNTLFEMCFRLRDEASAAAGRRIPLIVENVKGAQKWVGKAQAHYGSFYLWGDIHPVGRNIVCGNSFGLVLRTPGRAPLKSGDVGWRDHDKPGYKGRQFQDKAMEFSGVKIGDQNSYRKTGEPSPRFTNASEGRKVDNHLGAEIPKGTGSTSWFFGNTKHELRSGTKSGGDWFSAGEPLRKLGSKSLARKAASAKIAKIPPPLARYVARAFKKAGQAG